MKGISLYPTISTGVETPDNVTGTKIAASDKQAMDVAIQSSVPIVTPSVGTSGATTVVSTVNETTWTLMPPVPLIDRQTVSIQNQSGVEIKVYLDATPGGYVGTIVPIDGERFYNVTDGCSVYIKAAVGSGAGLMVVVEEIK